jgi:hypothetical protein
MSFRLLLLVKLFFRVRSRCSSAEPLFRNSCIALELVLGELTSETTEAEAGDEIPVEASLMLAAPIPPATTTATLLVRAVSLANDG